MDLQETLRALHRAAQTFQGGTQITVDNLEESVNGMLTFLEFVEMAKHKGATGYEIERAMQGDFIGGSFG